MGEVVETQPTIGSNVEEVVHRNVHFNVWDLGGQESLRQGWSTYFLGSHAVIVVVDSTDRARIGMVKAELDKLLLNAVSQSETVAAGTHDRHDDAELDCCVRGLRRGRRAMRRCRCAIAGP